MEVIICINFIAIVPPIYFACTDLFAEFSKQTDSDLHSLLRVNIYNNESGNCYIYDDEVRRIKSETLVVCWS